MPRATPASRLVIIRREHAHNKAMFNLIVPKKGQTWISQLHQCDSFDALPLYPLFASRKVERKMLPDGHADQR
jgi:hypothetical protein